MKVLVITGDKSFKKGHSRFDVQANAVEKFEVVYWGAGSLFPKLPNTQFDVVTSQDPFFRGIVGWFATRKLKSHFNVQVHADIEKQGFLKRFIALFILKRADSIRVVSENLKEWAQRVGVRAPITVLPVYVNLEPFKALKRTSNVQPNVLWIGRFEEEKNPLLAIKVFEKIREAIPNVKMTMLGSGSMETIVRNAAKNIPIDFPGWRDSVEYLPSAHVVFSTSHVESWGASIVEALAAGVPVVAPDVGVAQEAGATIVPREKLAETVITVLKNKPDGVLKIKLLSENEWVKKWKENLNQSIM